jgi:hypothetical protein
VTSVLDAGDTLHAAAAREAGSLSLEGRGRVFVITSRPRAAGVECSSPAWVVRHFVRGGRLAPLLLGDRYLRVGRTRPFHELAASEEARARGIPTPSVLAAACYLGPVFYRADLVTGYIPGAMQLVEALFDLQRPGVGGALERRDALRAAGDLIRTLAKAGVTHRDLHAGNILLEWQGAAPRPHLLDLDRCVVAPAGRQVSPLSMLRRLERSLAKWERRTGLRLSQAEWATLRQGVEG